MNNFVEVLQFSLSVTMPIFLILALGVLLYRIKLINDNFVDVGSKLVFNVTLPALLFLSIIKTPLSEHSDFSLVIYGMIAVFLIYLLFEFFSARYIKEKADRGVVIQGGFRSNMGIIGLAYCVNAYGDDVYSVAPIYLGGVTILFNVLSVITLNKAVNKDANLKGTLLKVLKNPLILSILSAVIVSYSGITMPEIILKTGNYFAQMTLSLALLCIGASLSFKTMKADLSNALISSFGKLIFIPIITTFGGYLLGYRGMELGVLLLMSSAPSASACYVMVKSIGGNDKLAANIIVITTLASILTTSFGITLLSTYKLM
ncbi:AEC family transporter [Marinomonas sp. 2405UD68-3]|uniref:AEC family transporter n=1 Tax=Marinomonas sp. 2405UD68-3 TaxID=3391835 RepID=UPI0039C8FF7E